MRNLVLRKKALGAFFMTTFFMTTYFVINSYPVVFPKGLDVTNQALSLQIHLRYPRHPQPLEGNH